MNYERIVMKSTINRIGHHSTLVVLAAALVMMLPSLSAASILIDFIESGSRVTATISGTLDLTSVTPSGLVGGSPPSITPSSGSFLDSKNGNRNIYSLDSGGPSNFGTGGFSTPDIATMSGISLRPDLGWLGLAVDFIPGVVAGELVWATGAPSFASLGIVPADGLVWTVAGSSETVTMTFGTVVPEPSSITLIISTALMGAVVMRRRKRKPANVAS